MVFVFFPCLWLPQFITINSTPGATPHLLPLTLWWDYMWIVTHVPIAGHHSFFHMLHVHLPFFTPRSRPVSYTLPTVLRCVYTRCWFCVTFTFMDGYLIRGYRMPCPPDFVATGRLRLVTVVTATARYLRFMDERYATFTHWLAFVVMDVPRWNVL